jgi:hypothetical protein
MSESQPRENHSLSSFRKRFSSACGGLRVPDDTNGRQGVSDDALEHDDERAKRLSRLKARHSEETISAILDAIAGTSPGGDEYRSLGDHQNDWECAMMTLDSLAAAGFDVIAVSDQATEAS